MEEKVAVKKVAVVSVPQLQSNPPPPPLSFVVLELLILKMGRGLEKGWG